MSADVRTAVFGVFAKAPVPGKTKTRLARVIGNERAAALHEAFLQDTLSACCRVAPTVLFTAGDHDHPVLRRLANDAGIERRPQADGDLGLRMEEAMASLLVDHGTAILVGSDAPSLPGRVLREASMLPLSFGPSTDGGFYLVGSSARPNFGGLPWSSPRTLQETLRKNPGAAVLEPWFDVDHAEELELLRFQLRLDPSAAPATAAALRLVPGARA